MITANQGTTVRLKYLFVVQFDDQTLYEQNPEDVSLIDPEKRSCFYDVMQAVEKGKKIVWFLLTDNKNVYAVNLVHGYFQINGVTFYMHERRDLKDFRIVFFRQHTHHFNLNKEEQGHEIVYRMGWQTTVDGQNLQQVMEIQ